MDAVGNWKWLEAGALLAAGAAFGWWQLRDVKRAQAETRRRKALEQAQAQTAPVTASPQVEAHTRPTQARHDPKEGLHP
jgi:predicted negative regulator of RcsB-dependent stress response